MTVLEAGGIYPNPRRHRYVSSQQQQGRQYRNNADGILQAWKDAVYANTFEDFDLYRQLLCTELFCIEFAAQPGEQLENKNSKLDIVSYILFLTRDRRIYLPNLSACNPRICAVRSKTVGQLYGITVTSRIGTAHL